MKTKCFLFFSSLMLFSSTAFAQNTDCRTTLSIFSEHAKVKNYEQAKPLYTKLVENCPDFSLATYQYGARMFKHFLDEGDPAKKTENAQALIDSHKKRLQYFPGKTQTGDMLADIAQVMYDYGIGTKADQYAQFDKAWTKDKETFLSPKSLYTYFSLLVDLHDAGKKDLQDVFGKYDEVIAQIEKLENKQAQVAAPLIKKQEARQELTAKEKKTLEVSEIYLSNYSLIKGSIDKKLGQRADCENLIPMYQKDFEAKKDDIEWVKSASGRMFAKECTEEPLFEKLVEAQHQLEPSAKSALYLGKLAEKNGNNAKAMEYYNQSAELETNPADKARVYYTIANNYKEKGSYSNARSFYRKALEQKPSMGTAYLQIASMYAQSANNCGGTTFEKRAVYWLAADYAERAGRVDPSLKGNADQAVESYNGRAPQRSDIFQAGMAGKTVSVGCWIGESVRVPAL